VLAAVCDPSSSQACSVVASRTFVTLAIGLLLLPLSHFNRIHSLRLGSALAAATVLAVAAVVVYRGAQNADGSVVPGPMPLIKPGFPIFQGIPIEVFSIGNQVSGKLLMDIYFQ
jgi:amino acid permease